MSDNTQDFRPMQARYLELEAEVEALETDRKAYEEVTGNLRAEVEKLRIKNTELASSLDNYIAELGKAESELETVTRERGYALRDADLARERADRLEAEVEKLREEKEGYRAFWIKANVRADEAEAKLAEAREALREIADVTHEPDTRLVARAALASLEEKP